MGKRYSDEQLSRILGEHDAGLMVSGGRWDWLYYYGRLGPAGDRPRGCIEQVALNLTLSNDIDDIDGERAVWFNTAYRRGLNDASPDELLAALEAEGFA